MELMRQRGPVRIPALTAAAALLAVAAPDAASQVAQKATYLAAGSFELPSKGGEGSPETPSSIAAGAGGTIQVADERGLIFVYEATGAFIRSYGQPHLKRPIALAPDSGGVTYVLDAAAKQVLVFGADGSHLGGIGGAGRGAGRLDDPIDLALSASGYVHVLDRGRGAVQVFSRDGVFVREVPLGVAVREPTAVALGRDDRILVSDRRATAQLHVFPAFNEVPWAGGGPGAAEPLSFRGGAFEEPAAVATNELGTVFVLDRKSGRVWSRNRHAEQPVGSDDVLYGGAGTGRGSFREAVDIALADADELLILDQRLRKVERIQLATEAGRALAPESGFPVRVTRASARVPGIVHSIGYRPDGAPVLLVSDRDGTVRLVGAALERRVTVYGDTVRWPVPSPETFERRFAERLGEVGGAAMNDTMVVITEPRRNRFALYRLEDGAPLGTFGDNYDDNRRLKSVHGVQLLKDGHIVLCDTGNDRVVVFSADVASLLASFPFPKAFGLAVSPAGGLVVWNEDGSAVAYRAPDGSAFQPFPPGLLAGTAADAAFDRYGNFFVLHRGSGRVTVLDAWLEGVLIQMGAEGEIRRPERVAVDPDGNVFVSDGEGGPGVAFRWDTRFPSLGGLAVSHDGDVAVLTWEARPPEFVRLYEIEGAPDRAGAYTWLGASETPRFEIDAGAAGAVIPRYVRVAPVMITGVIGPATSPLPLLEFTAATAFRRGDHGTALRDAREALALADRGAMDLSGEARSSLQWIAFGSAYEEEDYRTAVEWAEALGEQGVPAERRAEYWLKLVQARFRLGDYANALEGAQRLLEQLPDSEMGAGARPLADTLVWVAFSSAYELRDYRTVVAWGERLAATAATERRAEVHRKILEAHLELAEPDLAAGRLVSLGGEAAPAAVLQDSAVVHLSFRIYAALQAADTAGAGLRFLEEYAAILPGTLGDLRRMYEDSIAVFRTRAELALALDHWRNANYAEVVRFAQRRLRQPDLPLEQAILCRQLLAAAFYTFGRQNDAAEALRAVYSLAPDFDLESGAERVERLYGVTLYTPEMLEFFLGLRPGP
ncbi:MAG: hypothetical protein HY704_06425 [Gemmatimonadetes bacterium]|nr:hypothetical protein [Gemmatimonadota bacterium]